jgi:hypothetical protein
MNGVDERPSPGVVGPADDVGDRIDRPDRVGRPADADEPGPRAEQSLEVL